MKAEYPIYKYVPEKSPHKIDDAKNLSKKDTWQTIKLNASNDHSFAESILKVKKREWMHEYVALMDSKIKQTENTLSLQGLTVHRNLAQVYEQFNWIVWAVSHFYFENHLFSSKKYGLPMVEDDAWVDGFMWKGIYFRLVPLLQATQIKQEIQALKHITLELEECFSLEDNYSKKFGVNTDDSFHKRIIPPLLSISECGSYAIYGAPEMPILKAGSSNPNKCIKNLQSSMDVDLSKSMLELMPCLSKLEPSNLVPLNLQDQDGKYLLVNTYKALPDYHPDVYSKCMIRIPQDNSEEITMFSYPSKGQMPLADLVSLFVDGKMDDRDTPRSQDGVKKERENFRECNFYAQGCKVKILLYDGQSSNQVTNERARAVFMARDERVWKMAGLNSVPPTKEMLSNFLIENNMIGEPEEVKGDAILVVEQYTNTFKLPY